MKPKISLRISELDLARLKTEAQDASVPFSDYLRSLIARRPQQNSMADALIEGRLDRMEKMLLASTISSFEAQMIARGNLTPDRLAKAGRIVDEQIKAWAGIGVRPAAGFDLGTMLPKTDKGEY
ncbi:MAG: hypothetical protein ACYDEV_08825 [Acidiferrobacter sp.]